MYLAQERINQQTPYYIRETFQEDSQLKSRVLFDLGADPTQYIIYPGGKGYYFDEVVEETLIERGVNPTEGELDRIFWDFLDPEIQRVIQGFERKTKTPQSSL